MTVCLAGIGVSKGLAIGNAVILNNGAPEILESVIPRKLISEEVNRFLSALDKARLHLENIRSRIPTDTPEDIMAFMDAHLLMLQDKRISEAPIKIIRTLGCNAEWALKLQRDVLFQYFNNIDDSYLRTRKDDIDHVITNIQRILLQEEIQTINDIDPESSSILITDDLSPGDAVLMRDHGIKAIITEYGNQQSHSVIIARSLGIPAIAGVRYARRLIQENELLVVDGDLGILLASAELRSITEFKNRIRNRKLRESRLDEIIVVPSITVDHHFITLQANIELPEDVKRAKKVNAAGIGLYRTEFLYMNRDTLPDEEEQFETYRSVVRSLKGLPITIRTMDIGADKQVDGQAPLIKATANPALGLRAIRLCLKDHDLFTTQLRAILRASALGPVNLLIPMLCNLQEVMQTKAIIEQVKEQLRAKKMKFDPNIPLGGMIEIPAAAITANAFARHLDFLSIGTNDLIQYTLAIDRVDDDVNYLYEPFHPAVLYLIQQVINAGVKADIPVSMCGEMASDTRNTRLLLGMGLRIFSLHTASLLEVKSIIHSTDISKIQPIVRKILRDGNLENTLELINKLNLQ